MRKHNQIKSQNTIKELNSLVKKVCHSRQISLYHFKYGPKKYTQHQWVALLILHARSGQSLRKFIDSLYESLWPEWLNLSDIPSKSSLQSHLSRIGLTIVRELNKIIVQSQKQVKLAIDSTGIDAGSISKHYEKRIGRVRSPFLKLSILSSVTCPHIIYDYIAVNGHVHDVQHAKKLCKRLKLRNCTIYADKAYDCEELMEINSKNHNKLYCPIRDFKVKRPKGKHRRKLANEFNKDEYHIRNNVETIMFLLKNFGFIIRAKKKSNQLKEVAWKVLAYNINRLAKTYCLLIQKFFLDKAEVRVISPEGLFHFTIGSGLIILSGIIEKSSSSI